MSGGAEERGLSRIEARARVLSGDVPLGEDFVSDLPGHESHEARLHPDHHGHWQYRCLRCGRGWSLAEAFAGSRDRWGVGRVEVSRWGERLDYEAGLREPYLVDLRLPDHTPRSARGVAHGIALMLGLRGDRWVNRDVFTFARDFAVAYTGLTSEQVKRGMRWLERNGIICRADTIRVDQVRNLIVWRLCPAPRGDAPGLTEAELIQQVLELFPGARELRKDEP